MNNWKCGQCGLWNQHDVDACRRCSASKFALPAAAAAVPRFMQPSGSLQPPPGFVPSPFPYPTTPSEYVNKGGKTCPRCGITNSVSHASGQVWVVLVIAFISCGIGLIMIPFLPKTWYCNHCGCTW